MRCGSKSAESRSQGSISRTLSFARWVCSVGKKCRPNRSTQSRGRPRNASPPLLFMPAPVRRGTLCVRLRPFIHVQVASCGVENGGVIAAVEIDIRLDEKLIGKKPAAVSHQRAHEPGCRRRSAGATIRKRGSKTVASVKQPTKTNNKTSRIIRSAFCGGRPARSHPGRIAV